MSEQAQPRLRLPLKRLLAEGVLIVVSILLAFGIQAWWEGHRERREVEDALVGLRADFERNLTSLAEAREANQAIQLAAQGLLALTGPPGSTVPTHDEVPELVQGILGRHRLANYDAHLQSLLNTGRWDLLRSETLKEALTNWSTLVRNLSRREEEAVEGINNRLIVRIWQLAPMRTLDMPIAEFREAVGPSRFPIDYDRLLGDMYFEAAVDERWQDAFNLLVAIDQLEASARDILVLIDRELGGDPA